MDIGMNRFKLICLVGLALSVMTAKGQNYTTPFNHCLLDEKVYDQLVGESSGEQAYYHILDIAPYERDRQASDYSGLFMESKYVVNLLKSYGIDNATVEQLGKTKTWDGISASMWEVSPKTAKIADYRDLAAILGQGSKNTDVTAPLVWVGQGDSLTISALDLKGKIAVTEAAASRVHDRLVGAGALGVVSFYSPRPLIDPLQIPNSGIRGNNPTFCINLTPRDGYALRDRLLKGETITVHVKIEATTEETEIEVPTCVIPGSDPEAGEVIFSAHLFEGYVKLGANDNISGSMALVETARTLNQLIRDGRIPQPKRSIRFIWVPEFQGTIPWAIKHKDLLNNMLCNINLDMVGLWLSKHGSYLCMHRTTMGNPHYLNDVAESFFHYMGATNKAFVATGVGRPEALKPVFSTTGSHDPFYYSINAHYGASDHQVFNDWGVQVPGIILITWPDNFYHTSGDRPSICDPTQLRRAVVLASATAYTIASADLDGALSIAGEVASNAQKRIGLKLAEDLSGWNKLSADQLAAAYKKAVFDQEAVVLNEIATLRTVQELAPGEKVLADYLETLVSSLKSTLALNKANLAMALKARTKALDVMVSDKIALTAEEKAASKVFPKSTSLVKERGYGVLNSIPQELSKKYGLLKGTRLSLAHGDDIAKLTVSGDLSVLDIKKMQDAQFPDADSLSDIMRFMDLLKEAGLVAF